MARNAEQVLISAVIKTGEIGEALAAGVTLSWFREYKAEWNFISMRYKRTRTVPSQRVFKLKYPSFRIIDVDDLDYAIGEIRTWHAKQSFIGLMDEAVEGIEGGSDVPELISTMYRGLVDLSGDMTGKANETDVVTDWRKSYAEVLRRSVAKGKGKSMGLPTGFPTMDLVSGGWNAGDYIVHAARLGQGKTWSLIRTAVAVVLAGGTVEYHALEMSNMQLSFRMMPFLSRHLNGGKVFKASDLQHGTANMKDYRLFMDMLSKDCKGQLILDDTPRGRLNSLSLAAKIERNKPDMVIVDYLGLMNATPGDWGAVAALSSDMKEIATTYGITVIVANQLNRTAAIGSNNAGPETLSGSDAIGQDADGVITMKKISKRVIRMFNAKFRHGEDGNSWMIHFEPNIGLFEEISEDKAMDLKDEDMAKGDK